MRRVIVVVAALCVAVAGAVPAEAGRAQDEYQRLYEKVREKHGKRAPGRNIVRYGLPSGKDPSKARVLRSIAVLERMLAPPPEPVAVQATQPTVSAAPTGGGVPAELEAIAQCESGGDYSAVNPSSGAYGKYQIMPSTAAAYGCDLATPAGQDACAVKIYAGGAGRGQWVC